MLAAMLVSGEAAPGYSGAFILDLDYITVLR